MIVYDLMCSVGHVFEAWFGSSADYEDQKKRGLLSCPACGDADIGKGVMAPHVGVKSNQKQEPSASPREAHEDRGGEALKTAPETAQVMAPNKDGKEMMRLLAQLQRHVEQNFDYVGPEFAKEARRIHEGDADDRGIYGEVTAEETKALLEEGIDILPMPLPGKARRFDG